MEKLELKVDEVTAQILEISEKINDLYKLKLNIERYERENRVLDKKMANFDKALMELTFEIKEMKNNRLEDRDLRKEDRDLMNTIIFQMNELKQAVNQTCIDYTELSTNQKHTNNEIKIISSNLDKLVNVVSESNNTPFKVLLSLYNKSKYFKYCCNILLILVLFSLVSFLTSGEIGIIDFIKLINS